MTTIESILLSVLLTLSKVSELQREFLRRSWNEEIDARQMKSKLVLPTKDKD